MPPFADTIFNMYKFSILAEGGRKAKKSGRTTPEAKNKAQAQKSWVKVVSKKQVML